MPLCFIYLVYLTQSDIIQFVLADVYLGSDLSDSITERERERERVS